MTHTSRDRTIGGDELLNEYGDFVLVKARTGMRNYEVRACNHGKTLAKETLLEFAERLFWIVVHKYNACSPEEQREWERTGIPPGGWGNSFWVYEHLRPDGGRIMPNIPIDTRHEYIF